jgi:hypothetical protein
VPGENCWRGRFELISPPFDPKFSAVVAELVEVSGGLSAKECETSVTGTICI